MITFGEKLKIYIEQEGLNLKKFSEKAGVEYSAFRNLLVNFKRNKGYLHLYIEYCKVIGYRIDFLLIDKENGNQIIDSGMTAGSILKKAMKLKQLMIVDIAENLGISVAGASKRIRSLSENVAKIDKFIELVNAIGYDIEVIFVKE